MQVKSLPHLSKSPPLINVQQQIFRYQVKSAHGHFGTYLNTGSQIGISIKYNYIIYNKIYIYKWEKKWIYY